MMNNNNNNLIELQPVVLPTNVPLAESLNAEFPLLPNVVLTNDEKLGTSTSRLNRAINYSNVKPREVGVIVRDHATLTNRLVGGNFDNGDKNIHSIFFLIYINKN